MVDVGNLTPCFEPPELLYIRIVEKKLETTIMGYICVALAIYWGS